jgi:carbon storage regulator
MLVLSRRIGEKILIEKDIIVTILSVQGNKVRVGITAPQNIQVFREELLNQHTSLESRENRSIRQEEGD